MFKINCVAQVKWSSGLQDNRNNDGKNIAVILDTQRERASKYKDFIEGNKNEIKTDTIIAVAYGLVAEYISKCIAKDRNALIEFNGYLECGGDKKKANSSQITYYEKDMSKPFDDPSAYEEVDSGFDDNVYIKLDNFKMLIKEATLISSSQKYKEQKKTASRTNNTNKSNTNETKGTEKDKSFKEVDEDWD